MKKVYALILFLLIYNLTASQIEVTSFTFDPENPDPGDSVTILVRLTNKSYETDMDVTCRLFINETLHDVKIVPIGRRSSSQVSFSWTAEPGYHSFSLEMSYYTAHTENAETFIQYLTVLGTEEIDYFAEAVALYEKESFIQAKIMFEQAKQIFEANQETERAVDCEEYIMKCDQYIEALQLYEKAEKALAAEDFASALLNYSQAKTVYESLNDRRARLCEEKIQSIYDMQRKQRTYTYSILILVPVATLVVAVVWLRRRKIHFLRKKPPSFPEYVPEQRMRKETQKKEKYEEKIEKERKRLFEDTEKPAVMKELERIESQINTEDPQTFRSLIEDFKDQESHFDKRDYTEGEAEYIEETMETVKESLKERGKRLQDIQKLRDVKRRITHLLDQPIDDLVDAYNRYAKLQNTFDQIADLRTEEQEEVRARLREYYQSIQQQAKSEQVERQ